ncbi:MAG: hypothetical protein J0I13_13205 [Rhizobiales bacterium]|jgi:hypothetical protein|nr:hypothetical protein [Hyphomicrobiales bacterium]
MQPVQLQLAPDGARLTCIIDGSSVELPADAVDALIRDLAAARAQMIPIHPAEPPDDPAQLHHSDNLLWSVKAALDRAAIAFAMQHPGLGWSAMWLSREQVEDLQTSFEFELAKIPAEIPENRS